MNPGDTSTLPTMTESTTTLNEGRGLNPGDTCCAVPISASRRLRSTKAGA